MSPAAPDRAPPPPPRPRAAAPPARPAPAPAARGRGLIFPRPDLRGPKLILGVVWAAGVTVTLVVGATPFALLMAGMAATAAAQAARSWKRAATPRSPLAPAAQVAAALTVLGALLGPTGLVVVAVLAVIGVSAWVIADATRHHRAPAPLDLVLTLVCAAVPAAAVAAPVLLRRHGLEVVFVLMADALVYDAAAWIMGSGSRHRWFGPLCGMVCIGPVTMAVAAVALQFRGTTPWELGGLAAVLAPLGPAAASFVLGDRRAPAGALRRIDSLVLLGPIWAIVATRLGV